MKMHTSLMSMSLIALMATSTFAQAQNYSQHRYTTADEGRRRSEERRVGEECRSRWGGGGGGAKSRTIQGNSQQNNGDRRVERVCERR